MAAVAASLVIGVPRATKAASSAAHRLSCMGWEHGDVVGPNNTFFAFDKVPRKKEREYARIHYMIGDGFLGPGDDWYTSAVRRDILDPPLDDGEDVVFEETDGKVVRVRRDC